MQLVRVAMAAAGVAAAVVLWSGAAGAAEMQRVCCNAPVPHGFIKVGDMWNPTDCGNPQQIVYNQCTIENYESMPVGATLQVCASAGTPSGWTQVSTTWNPTKCGNPTGIVQNVATIKREK